jgi:hypothetical protein
MLWPRKAFVMEPPDTDEMMATSDATEEPSSRLAFTR